MPTVLRSGRFVVRVYGPPREHGPAHAHVHIHGVSGYVVVRLSAGERPAEIREVVGEVRARDAAEAERLVAANEPAIRAFWEKLHGH